MRIPLFLLLLLLVVARAAPLRGAEPDHDRARRAVEAGEILPLSKILAVVENSFEGLLLEVELEREKGRFVYEIELLTDAGHVIEITLDARDAEILETEGEGVEEARKKR